MYAAPSALYFDHLKGRLGVRGRAGRALGGVWRVRLGLCGGRLGLCGSGWVCVGPAGAVWGPAGAVRVRGPSPGGVVRAEPARSRGRRLANSAAPSVGTARQRPAPARTPRAESRSSSATFHFSNIYFV